MGGLCWRAMILFGKDKSSMMQYESIEYSCILGGDDEIQCCWNTGIRKFSDALDEGVWTVWFIISNDEWAEMSMDEKLKAKKIINEIPYKL